MNAQEQMMLHDAQRLFPRQNIKMLRIFHDLQYVVLYDQDGHPRRTLDLRYTQDVRDDNARMLLVLAKLKRLI